MNSGRRSTCSSPSPRATAETCSQRLVRRHTIVGLLVGVILATAAPLARPQSVAALSRSPSTAEEMAAFLRTADVIKSESVGKGVTGISRLTLSDGTFTHDAAFQSIEERHLKWTSSTGETEIRFADSYHFNIAGYRLAVLLGIGDMVPVTVERRWRGTVGALSWWVDFEFDEGERIEKELIPPDIRSWNEQKNRMRIFSALIYDTDRNVGNILITKDWKIWMIDFTRAFRLLEAIPSPGSLVRGDRRLLGRLEALSMDEVRAAVEDHLRDYELEPLMARRDLIVEHYRKLVAERGEGAVLY